MKPTLPSLESFGQTRTLFLTAGTSAAILLTPRGKAHRQRKMHFTDPQAALVWCIAERANLVYLAAPIPALN